MIKVQSKDGKFHLIPHFHGETIKVLRVLQERFDGAFAVASANHNQYVPLDSLLLDTATETNVEIVK